ncbi:MAG: DUF5683 domain-containing protein [Bacteroidales bacterium]|nr:DUF5683 domain-containing protein [Bacteroidales bacterium]
MAINKKIYSTIFLLLICSICLSQTDTTAFSTLKVHSPKRAAIYSTVVPGLGQIYNKKYWKLPIVYVGIGGFTYFAIDNQKEFNRYKNAYILREDGKDDEFMGILNEQALLNEMDRWRKYRDLCIAGAVLIYALQIIDANIDAHLMDFDIGDNLSVKLMPSQFNTRFSRSTVMGFGCIINF